MNQEKTPASVTQLAAALAALGAYGGANTAAEHAAEAKRLDDSEEFYRMRLAYALLGAAEKQAALASTAEGPEDRVSIAHRQALECAGVTESSALLLDFLRWRTLGVGLTLRQIVGTGDRGGAARRRTCRRRAAAAAGDIRRRPGP